MRTLAFVIVEASTGALSGMSSGAVVENPSSVARPAAAGPNAGLLRTLPVAGSRRKSDGNASWPEPVSASGRRHRLRLERLDARELLVREDRVDRGERGELTPRRLPAARGRRSPPASASRRRSSRAASRRSPAAARAEPPAPPAAPRRLVLTVREIDVLRHERDRLFRADLASVARLTPLAPPRSAAT